MPKWRRWVCKKMDDQRNCRTCDTYQLCKTYDRFPPGETGCDDWEPAREACPQLPEENMT